MLIIGQHVFCFTFGSSFAKAGCVSPDEILIKHIVVITVTHYDYRSVFNDFLVLCRSLVHLNFLESHFFLRRERWLIILNVDHGVLVSYIFISL